MIKKQRQCCLVLALLIAAILLFASVDLPTTMALEPQSANDIPAVGTVVNQTNTSKTIYLGVNPKTGKYIYSTDASVGWQYYQDDKGSWLDIKPQLVRSGNKYITEGTPYLVEFGLDGSRRIYPDRYDLTRYIDIPSIPLFRTLSKTWDPKAVTCQTSNYDIAFKLSNTGVHFEVLFKNYPTFSSIQFPVTAVGYDIEKLLESKEGVGIPRPQLVDAEGNERWLKWSYKQNQLELILDFSGLVFPILLRNTTIDDQVDASTDDASERVSPDYMYLDDDEVVVRADTGELYHYGGFRFHNGTFPSQGDTIDVAYIEVYTYNYNYDDVNANIHFELGATPATFADTSHNISGRSTTTAFVLWDATVLGLGWIQSPSLVTPAQELIDSYSPSAVNVIAKAKTDKNARLYVRSVDFDSALAAKLHLEWESGGVVPPTVTTSTASNVEDTTATGNGSITDTGGENCDHRGVVWDDATHGDPGNTAPASSDYVTAGGGYADESGDFGAGAFTASMTSLPTGTTIYYRAWAHNSAGYSYGGEETFLTKPAAPTNVAASDGSDTTKVVVTWTKSAGATGYDIYRDAVEIDTVGDVATYDDTGADAPTITPGSTVATDGTSGLHVALSLSGTSANNGTTHTYKVVAFNATGDSDDSNTDTGYRGVGALTYQWQRSSGDADEDYSDISGATSSTYNDTAAPAPTITPGDTNASDGTSSSYVTLTVTGEAGNNGIGRYYQCVLNATGATEQTSASNRGYRGTSTLTYQWLRSATDSDDNFSNIEGATTDPYNDTDGVVEPDGRYYYCEVSMSGAVTQDTTHDRGYKSSILVVGPPISFDAFYNSDNEIGLSWTLGEGAAYTFIRSKQGSYPTSITDGEQVYYGDGSSTTDNNIAELSTHRYYRAWSGDGDGNYSEEYAEDYVEGIDMSLLAENVYLIASLLSVAGLVALAYWKNQASLYVVAVSALIIVGWQWEWRIMVPLVLLAIYTGYRAVRPWLPR